MVTWFPLLKHLYDILGEAGVVTAVRGMIPLREDYCTEME